ncbi:hypothetical protein VTI74DRAFT_6369 [Chaetomium olivicolor]
MGNENLPSMAHGRQPNQVNGVKAINGANGYGLNGVNGVHHWPPKVPFKPPQETLMNGTSNVSERPFFWKVIPIGDLYHMAHIVFLPGPSIDTADTRPRHHPCSPLPNQGGIAGSLAIIGLGGVHRPTQSVTVFTAILPSTDGFVARSDFLQLRLQDFPYPITKIQESVCPLKKYIASSPCPMSVSSEADVATLVERAAGVIQWAELDGSTTIDGLQRYLLWLSHELGARLSNAPWLTSQPIARKRIALVRGRPNITAGGPVYRAARALGLDLVIIDDEGHWLQPDTPENKLHREAFIATDLTEDSGVIDRIIASINSYPLPIHGVFTLSDNFFVAVAKVAEALGLPSSPSSAFETTVDKYKSRLLQNSPGQTTLINTLAELEDLLKPTKDVPARFTPSYPLIVKPTKGWSSECVSKVTQPEDLPLAVAKATSRHGTAAVIEPFFDGPEIDVNFILLDGEVLFCEIADEPPCRADAEDASVEDTFSPEALTLPSALPADEQEVAKETLREILVERLGVRTGVFHVEARVIHSGWEYKHVGGGVVDLVKKETMTGEKAECKLVEINARPPGYRVSVPSRHTYGVDYFAAHMLAAVGDYGRLKMVARGFEHEAAGRTKGAQYWSRLVYVPAPKEGVVRWPGGVTPCEELKRRRPDLAEKIVLGVDYCVPGERVGLFTDGARTYVAHLLVCSRVSRRDAIEVGEEVLRAFRIEVD